MGDVLAFPEVRSLGRMADTLRGIELELQEISGRLSACDALQVTALSTRAMSVRFGVQNAARGVAESRDTAMREAGDLAEELQRMLVRLREIAGAVEQAS